MCIVHRLAVKLRTVVRWTFAARGETTVVALAKVKMMIDVSVKTFGPVEPGSRPDEYTA
jgi:hypothetical protein